jgi:hypothetical protein
MTKLTLSRQMDDKHSVKVAQVQEDKVYADLIKQKVQLRLKCVGRGV